MKRYHKHELIDANDKMDANCIIHAQCDGKEQTQGQGVGVGKPQEHPELEPLYIFNHLAGE